MSELVLEVHERDATGKNANRRLRAVGQVPAVVYGAKQDAVSIRVEQSKVGEILKSGHGGNAVFLLQLHGTEQQRHAMIRELQTDSITGAMIHIDFQRILMDQKVKVMVPIELAGEPEGVKTEGGLLDFVTRDVEVECLPGQIPEHLPLDVSSLHIGQHFEAKDLDLPSGVDLLADPDRVIVSVAVRKAAEVEEEAEEEELLIEAEAEEPEVIQRGKAEDEE
ncbi:MAG: 50S ribosomal protein L25 [bacterium]|nr:50S ribosomal protein L25 [bacterium]